MSTPASSLQRINPVITQLRGAALKELSASDASTQAKGKPTFDSTHKKTPTNDRSYEDFDSSNGVADYPGQNIEHIGNGPGGVRR